MNKYTPKPIVNPEYTPLVVMGVTLQTIPVSLSPEEYRLCAEKAPLFWANSKTGEYGKGLLKTNDDPSAPVRIGLMGEMSFAKLFGQSIDLSYREKGDHQDFLIEGLRFDIKCASYNYEKVLVQHTNEKGYRIYPNKHFYVASYLESEDKEKESATINFVGWMTKGQLENCVVDEGKRGNQRGRRHLNYELYFEDLRPISDLLKLKDSLTEIRKMIKEAS